jgi:hypothetical protein
MLDHLPHCSQVLDHLGLVAGMFDELGIGDVLNQATQQNPEMRDLTLGEAVKAMVLSCGALQRAPPHDLPGDHHRRTTASPSDRGARVGGRWFRGPRGDGARGMAGRRRRASPPRTLINYFGSGL